MAPGNRSAPGVRLTLFKDDKATTGKPLNFGTRLLSFAFEDCEAKADKLTLTLDNVDLALFDREALMAGAVLEVSWGYPDAMAPPRRGVVKSMNGFQTLTLEGQALAALMNQQAKTRRWESKSRADVVRDVAKESGYDGAFVDIEDTKEVIDVVNQTAETDARFLKRRAAREGFAFWIDGTGLHFHRRKQDAAPTHVFTCRTARKSPTPRSRWRARGARSRSGPARSRRAKGRRTTTPSRASRLGGDPQKSQRRAARRCKARSPRASSAVRAGAEAGAAGVP